LATLLSSLLWTHKATHATGDVGEGRQGSRLPWMWFHANCRVLQWANKPFFIFTPTDAQLAERATRGHNIRVATPLFMMNSRNLPAIDGDLNCFFFQEVLETTENHRFRPLPDFLSAFPPMECFRQCHSGLREYTSYRPGEARSCLDRA
jgi:hypothetical protein